MVSDADVIIVQKYSFQNQILILDMYCSCGYVILHQILSHYS